jgi:hypothetical protein
MNNSGLAIRISYTRLPHVLLAFSWSAAPTITAHFCAQRSPSRSYRVHDACCHALDRGSAAFRPFPTIGPDKFWRLARPLWKFRSLALPALVPIPLFLYLKRFLHRSRRSRSLPAFPALPALPALLPPGTATNLSESWRQAFPYRT